MVMSPLLCRASPQGPNGGQISIGIKGTFDALWSGMRTTLSDKEAIVWHDNFEPHQTIYQEARRRPLYCIEGFFFFQYF